MSSLACVAAEVNESTGSAFLIAFQQHAAAMGFFRPIADRLRVKMKAVRYSVLQKGQTLVASILLGCPYTSSINHRLVPDSVAAREWGMERFPDQSQVNLFLNRITPRTWLSWSKRIKSCCTRTRCSGQPHRWSSSSTSPGGGCP